MGWGRVWIALAATVAVVATSASLASGRESSTPEFTCAVGQPPANATPTNLGGGLRISDQLDVACGRFGRERVAIVGYVEHFRGHRQTCFNLERRGGSLGIACEREYEVPFAIRCPVQCITAYPVDATEQHRALHTVVTAVVPVGTDRVTIKAGAGKRARTVAALVAPVEGALMEAFGEEDPVVLAAAVVGGCYRAPGVRLVASSADGDVLLRARGRLSFPRQCRIPHYPPPPGDPRLTRLRITVE